MEVLITPHVKVKYNSYTDNINTARNTKVASTNNVFEKTIMKRKKKYFQRRI